MCTRDTDTGIDIDTKIHDNGDSDIANDIYDDFLDSILFNCFTNRVCLTIKVFD